MPESEPTVPSGAVGAEPVADDEVVEGEVIDGEVIDGEVDADAVASSADVEALRAERDGLVDDLRRLQAEFSNYKKRMLRDQTAVVERASEGLVEQLLSVLDNFELALLSLEADDNVRKGVELVFADFFAVLEKAGLARIAAQGAPFDPNEHEAVLQEEGDHEPVVAEVMRAGYTLKGRVLRPAMVRVSRAGR